MRPCLHRGSAIRGGVIHSPVTLHAPRLSCRRPERMYQQLREVCAAPEGLPATSEEHHAGPEHGERRLGLHLPDHGSGSVNKLAGVVDSHTGSAGEVDGHRLYSIVIERPSKWQFHSNSSGNEWKEACTTSM